MSYEFSGEFTVATARDEVFAVLASTPRFAPLLPTYISHEMRADGSAAIQVRVGVGKVKGTGEVVLALEESVVPVRARYSGKGKVMGGVFNLDAGFELEDAGAGATRVKWRGEMVMFGKLVSLAGGLVKPIAERDINQLIEALQTELGGAVEPAGPVSPAAPPGWFARLRAWFMGLFTRGDRPAAKDAGPSTSSDDRG